MIRKAALGNVAFLAENMPTARHLAEFREACGRIAVRDEVAVDDVAVDDADKKAVGCDEKKTLALRLDESDYLDIIDAVSLLGSVASGHAIERTDQGSCVAEICRDWDRRVTSDRKSARKRTENCDGTVTFWVPVTVREDVLEGRDVLAVRQPKRGEKYLGTDGIVADAEYDWDSARTGVRVILGPKPQPPAPQFREGCTYRDGNNRLCGPLMPSGNSEYPLLDQRGDMYTTEGVCRLFTPDAEANLLPEEVIVWRHPGLRAGEYRWSKDGVLRGGGFIVVHGSTTCYLSSWIDPPRIGKWLVRDGQEYATWEGE